MAPMRRNRKNDSPPPEILAFVDAAQRLVRSKDSGDGAGHLEAHADLREITSRLTARTDTEHEGKDDQ